VRIPTKAATQASVSDYLSRARRAGLTWPLPDGLDDAQLEALLFPPRAQRNSRQWAWKPEYTVLQPCQAK
jgi:transposase